jgi:RNA polymerase sigma-70 factor (ECF subfamily)
MVLGKLDDLELFSLLRDGDRTAYTEIYHRYKPLLYIHAYKRLRDEDMAIDIVHDMFVSLWNNRHNIQPELGIRAYLFTMVRNRIFDLLARKQIESKYIDSLRHFLNQHENHTDYPLRYKQLTEILEIEISLLPAKMQQVFRMSRTDQLTHNEIAEKLNISETTVKKQVQNALKVLKTKLGPLFFIVFI